MARTSSHRGAVLIAAIIATAAVLAFLGLAYLIRTPERMRFDQDVIRYFRNPEDAGDPIGPGWFEEMQRDLTALGSVAVLGLITIAALAYSLMRREKITALIVLFSTGGGMIASLALKNYYDRPRPDLVPHLSLVHTHSFPSGHSMMSAITYLTLAVILVRVQHKRPLKVFLFAVAVLLMVLVGTSRVYLGVHWPSDVLAGWAMGIAWASTTWGVSRYVDRKSGLRPESELEAVPD